MASDTKLTEIQKILDPFLGNNSTTSTTTADPSFDPLSPKPSPGSVASPDPPSFDQFSPPYPPPEEVPCRQKKQRRVIDTRPPPPSYEETMALRRSQESQLQELLNDSFQQRSYSFNDLQQEVPENEFAVVQGRWTSDGVLGSSTWQPASDNSIQQQFAPSPSPGSSISYETSSLWPQMGEDIGSPDVGNPIESPTYQQQQQQQLASPDVRDPFTPPLPWRQTSLPQQPPSTGFTDLPADLAEWVSDNGFGGGDVPRSNSVPADMSYNDPNNFEFMNTSQ